MALGWLGKVEEMCVGNLIHFPTCETSSRVPSHSTLDREIRETNLSSIKRVSNKLTLFIRYFVETGEC